MKREFKSGDIVKHFKRETLTAAEKAQNKYLYKILCTALNSETMEEMIVYMALYGDFKAYVRPAAMFYSEVDRDKYPDIKQQYRFEKCEELS